MNTKRAVITQLISLMDATRDAAISSIKLAKPDEPRPMGQFPVSQSLGEFNMAAEMIKRIVNLDITAEIIIAAYQPGIITELVRQQAIDFDDPRSVNSVINDWLGINMVED